MRDAAGNVAYTTQSSAGGALQPHGNTFDGTESVTASILKGKQGSGILMSGDSEPSTPEDVGWTQLFGLHDGKLQPLSPPIYSVLTEVTNDPTRGGGDILKFELWTGNLHLVYPVFINWYAGRLEPAWRCIRGPMPAQVERCDYQLKVDPREVQERTFIRLFADTEEATTPKHVVIDPGTKIEFLLAEAHIQWKGNAHALDLEPDTRDLWVRIRVNGEEGWIHTQEDFNQVGLQAAD